MPAFVLILWLPATIALLSVTFVIALVSAAPVPKGSVPLSEGARAGGTGPASEGRSG
jgi:hypothetical protein